MADEMDVASSEDESTDWKSIHYGQSDDQPENLICNINQVNAGHAHNATSENESPVQRMALNDHKAGMKGLDKEKINQIIFETSKGSKFYENEKKKEQRVAERIKAMKEQMQTFTDIDFKKAKREARLFAKKAELERDLSHIIVHVDMDAFYAAVETRDNPKLKDIPMAVGSNSMLSTSNYVARKFGVRAAMPGYIAKKLCPNLTIVRENFQKYREVSNQVRDIISQYDPNFCGMGLDEAYLDITDHVNIIEEQRNGNTASSTCTGDKGAEDRQKLVEGIVQELREKIFQKTKLTASAGIACNVMLAKVCSDMNKPDGQFSLPPNREAILDFVKDLPIRKISGIGRVSEQVLNEFGITMCNDLYEKRALLFLMFSTISFEHFMRISLGVSSSILDNETKRKSMSSETTFKEISDPEKLYQVCHELCEGLANDLQKENLAGKCVTVKFKFTNFEVKTTAKTLPEHVDTSEEIYKAAKDIIKSQIKAYHPKKFQLRLLGVRLSEFGMKKKGVQGTLHSFLSRGNLYNNEKTSVQPNNTGEKVQEVSYEKTKESTSDNSSDFVICPVCQNSQKANDINIHIDLCLNKQTIRKMLSVERNVEKEGEKSVKGKSQKRKIDSVEENKKPLKKITLHSFWNTDSEN